MKELKWGKILSVGVEEIDEDHRKLVDIFNVLNHAVAEGEAPDYLAAVLDELLNCTVWHFSHEERLMLKHRYPEMADHKAEHRDLINSAQELQQELLSADKAVADEPFIVPLAIPLGVMLCLLFVAVAPVSYRVLTFFADDGRLFFVIPMGDRTCVGTTDTRMPSPESAVTDEDRHFVLDNINKRLNLKKPLTKADIVERIQSEVERA